MDSTREIKPQIGNRLLTAWETQEHRRLRVEPQSKDLDYPPMGDLNDFIKKYSSAEKLLILDYGAGASPYKIYFPNSDYRRADILEIPELSYRIGLKSEINESSETFDLILSTQVLEHVERVNEYLAESFRLLKKGGVLIVTTHGIWEEHGVPYDFQRWTEEGLKRDLKSAGYHEITFFKLTCGLRAGLYFFIKTLFAAKAPVHQPARFVFKAFRTTISKIFPLLYRFCDTFWPEEKISHVSPTTSDQTFYIGIAAIAKKS